MLGLEQERVVENMMQTKKILAQGWGLHLCWNTGRMLGRIDAPGKAKCLHHNSSYGCHTRGLEQEGGR